jgi:hypothetical protein
MARLRREIPYYREYNLLYGRKRRAELQLMEL